jgi:putative transposase
MAKNPFRYFKTSREIIQLGVLMYVRFPLSLRIVEDLLHERGIDVCHESVRLWVDRFGMYFAHRIVTVRSARPCGERLDADFGWMEADSVRLI